MRRLLSVFFFFACMLLILTGAHALTYQEGVRAAAKENKPLYLYFYNDG
jgi:hypothetical protein